MIVLATTKKVVRRTFSSVLAPGHHFLPTAVEQSPLHSQRENPVTSPVVGYTESRLILLIHRILVDISPSRK